MAKKSKIAKTKKLLAKNEVLLKSEVKKVNRVSTRGVNRCKITGRPRGYMRFFGLSRITFRELAAKGELPGVVKSSK
ncbi:MAG: 30S ribosomal protein S14 [Candidatus Pacebacteria bacterium GW2011_GWF2_38_9]|nr:MAG: ribosomal protein S14p/S29e family protein, small subunit ribosomal protein S14 [candidate division TM6 bacterium GW2011_GWF2_28_16]KKQ08252.1 MAG: 30S ribosomal protein S14 [Candidatus Pacebacteria bacterium GW2011_GWF1_36_5]KKQ88570.1 MAG: 30S ribosomal protein S14 [Candidatus Pacebacteria bacterium GW2011_GWF2_38_9]MBU1033543.1 30S ribosomal protein S14 [Patescibacteria group bacterium]HAZ73523.1 30S ribosomal protein S14 [Candidatus Paceibacterota bacterium]